MTDRNDIVRALMGVPLPRPRPLPLGIDKPVMYRDLPRIAPPMEPGLAEQLGAPNMGQIGIQMHFDHPRRPEVAGDQKLIDDNIRDTFRGISGMINPENFDKAWRSWPQSENIEVLPPLTLEDYGLPPRSR